MTVKWGIRFNPLLTATTGPPFDITAGQDIYGDGLFNARPGIATNPNKPGVVATKYGLLDPNPTPGEQLVSRNYGRGPGQIHAEHASWADIRFWTFAGRGQWSRFI